ncbi:hypothetical protein ACFE04_001829 [Oxalis oulophora]
MGRAVRMTMPEVFLSSWWDFINDSRKWESGFFYALCAAYALVASVALIQLIRIELRVPEYGWTTQKVFHLLNFIVMGVRAVVFGFHNEVFLIHPKTERGPNDVCEEAFFKCRSCFILFINKVILSILLDLPGLLFFSTYTLLVLFWAEIYHQARSLPTEKLRIVYISVNSVIYIIQIIIWIVELIHENNVVQLIGKIFMAVVSIIAALAFLVYGGRLFYMLSRFPIESKGRRKKLHEVGAVTAICFSCFIIRCIVVILSACDVNAYLDVLFHPVLNFIYYMLVEILPCALVLHIHLPKTKRLARTGIWFDAVGGESKKHRQNGNQGS